MKDFCIEQNSGTANPVLIGEILGRAGVNIEGLCFIDCEEHAIIHLLVEDEGTARRALEEAGIRIKAESDVFILDKDSRKVTGKPGSFGEVCRALTDNGIKLKFGYPAENNRFIFGLDDMEKARRVLAPPA